jgi:protein TonB
MPSHRLLFSLSLSVFLHLTAFGAGDLLCHKQVRQTPARPPMLDATLLPAMPAMPAEALLKDTIADTPAPAKHPVKEKAGTSGRLATAKAQKKLAEHVFYPEAAVAAGIEGDVRLLVTLDDHGRITQVTVADTSGYKILDQAAIRAAYAMGSLPGVDRHELILPVTFRLQP